MSQNDITRIMVGNTPIGIMGFKSLMKDLAKQLEKKPEQEIKEELLIQLSKKNYIPDNGKEKYGKALLREFYKYIGKPYEQEPGQRIQIKVLGSGCPQCDRLEMELITIMSETGIAADIEHIRDINEISKYGVGTPALIINEEVKSVGSVPPRSKLIKLLEKA